MGSRSLGKVLGAYKALFRLRMLIPIGLAIAILAYNTLGPEPLSLKQEVRAHVPVGYTGVNYESEGLLPTLALMVVLSQLYVSSESQAQPSMSLEMWNVYTYKTVA